MLAAISRYKAAKLSACAIPAGSRSEPAMAVPPRDRLCQQTVMMRRRAFARRVLASCVVLLAAWSVSLLPATVPPALAQSADDAMVSSYITPFPGGEQYKLRVIGDEFGDGINVALAEALGTDPRLDIEKKTVWMSGLSRPDSEAELQNVTQAAVRDKPHVAVIMLGGQDRWSYRAPNGKRHPVGTAEWRAIYTKRADDLIRGLKSAGAAIYWVGLPIMRRGELNEAVQAINDVIRERAYLNGVRYIDVYSGFTDEQGEYNAYGPDLAGKSRLLRDADGIHMTDAGYQKLAHFVERELKRDLTQAKNERAIPLAGSEAEQATINPNKLPVKPAGTPLWQTTSSGNAAAGASGEGNSGDQRADNSRINLKTQGADGREQVLPVDIVRPAIPAAVITLVTRRESADKPSQMGDQVIDQIPGGLTVMSSITPAGEGAAGLAARSKIAPTQTPFFRVLVKGERIAARPGRADDVSWPRPVPEPDPATPDAAPDAGSLDPTAAAAPTKAPPVPRAKPKR